MTARAFFEPIKTLAFGSISGSYASVGVPSTREIRIFCITNNTDGHLYFTTDIGEDQMFIPAGGFRLYDFMANLSPSDDSFALEVGIQWSVKQVTAPSEGDVYVESIY